MIAVTDVNDGMTKLAESMRGVSENLSKEVGIAIWKTAKSTKSFIAKQVDDELNVSQKVIKSVLKQEREDELTASVTVRKTGKIPLHKFRGGVTQNKVGVRAKISKTRGSKVFAHGFIVERWDGKAMLRETRGKGSGRGPVHMLRGPSPWGVVVKNNLSPQIVDYARSRLLDEFADRIRFNKLKQVGGLNWQQPDYVSDAATGEN